MSLRLLFASPHCLLDNASGAALSVATQLAGLNSRGWECRSVTGTALDTEARVNARAVMLSQGLKEVGAVGSRPVLGGMVNNVNHLVLPFSDTRRAHVTAADEMALFHLVSRQTDEFKPDILYLFGGLLLERAILRMARGKGIRTLFYLSNANYSDMAALENVSLILTPSDSLAAYYKDRHSLDLCAIGTFAAPEGKVAARCAPDCVTFINPSPEKGVALFVRIARSLPNIKFLVIESRWTSDKAAEALGLDWSTLPNVEFMPRQKDMRTVYERTRLLLFPSFWLEASGRVGIEAQLNGIPVLASRHGGIGETLAGGGFLFDVPERCRERFLSSPTADEARPWVECITRLLEDPSAMAEAEQRARAASAEHDVTMMTAHLDTRLKALCSA